MDKIMEVAHPCTNCLYYRYGRWSIDSVLSLSIIHISTLMQQLSVT